MTEIKNTLSEETHEVKEVVEKKGEVQFLTKEAFKNPAPVALKIVLSVIMDFSVTLTGLVAATTIFSGNQSKVIAFICACSYALCRAISKSTGVVSNTD